MRQERCCGVSSFSEIATNDFVMSCPHTAQPCSSNTSGAVSLQKYLMILSRNLYNGGDGGNMGLLSPQLS